MEHARRLMRPKLQQGALKPSKMPERPFHGCNWGCKSCRGRKIRSDYPGTGRDHGGFIGYLVAGLAGATAAALGIFLPVYLVSRERSLFSLDVRSTIGQPFLFVLLAL